MKRTLLISGFIFLAIVTFSQSIVTSNRLWDNLINYYAFPPPVIGTEHIKFTLDTVINSITYKKVERSLDEVQMDWSNYGYIREDSNKQIFYKINPIDTERMLYDLNVQLYDTILVYGLITSVNNYRELLPMTFYVTNIDSVLIDQSYRKRINLTIPEDTTFVFEQWIDSIGSTGGMLHNKYIYVGCDYYSLLCFFEDGILKFHDPNYESCYYISGVVERTTLTPTVAVFPNPISDFSILEINGIEETNSISICLYNLLGKEIYHSTGGKRMRISNNNFPPGIYFYDITFNNRVVGTGKIIIN
jgi:hypothetical protein